MVIPVKSHRIKRAYKMITVYCDKNLFRILQRTHQYFDLWGLKYVHKGKYVLPRVHVSQMKTMTVHYWKLSDIQVLLYFTMMGISWLKKINPSCAWYITVNNRAIITQRTSTGIPVCYSDAWVICKQIFLGLLICRRTM